MVVDLALAEERTLELIAWLCEVRPRLQTRRDQQALLRTIDRFLESFRTS